MYHKQVGRAAILELDLNDVRVVAVRYLATPTLALL